MCNNRQDNLSFHMRIPTKKVFAKNALLTLDGICDHFSFNESSRDRIKKALELALYNSIDLSYKEEPGLFDLQFSIYKNKMMILVEDYFLNPKEDINANEVNNDSVKNMLNSVKNFTDGLSFTGKKGCIACYSMSFDVSFIDA